MKRIGFFILAMLSSACSTQHASQCLEIEYFGDKPATFCPGPPGDYEVVKVKCNANRSGCMLTIQSKHEGSPDFPRIVR